MGRIQATVETAESIYLGHVLDNGPSTIDVHVRIKFNLGTHISPTPPQIRRDNRPPLDLSKPSRSFIVPRHVETSTNVCPG